VADQLVRTLEIPLLLIRPQEGSVQPEPRVGEILIPLDGSRRAEGALPVALSVASLLGAGLALVQVVLPVFFTIDESVALPRSVDEEVSALRRRQAQDYLDEVAERLRRSGVPASGAAVLGTSVYDAIEAIARSPAIGLIALATHGRGGLRRLVLGSVADKLVRAGDLPVLVIRPRGR
jgi:nucleotide-binding universal stress UspA family protein